MSDFTFDRAAARARCVDYQRHHDAQQVRRNAEGIASFDAHVMRGYLVRDLPAALDLLDEADAENQRLREQVTEWQERYRLSLSPEISRLRAALEAVAKPARVNIMIGDPIGDELAARIILAQQTLGMPGQS